MLNKGDVSRLYGHLDKIQKEASSGDILNDLTKDTAEKIKSNANFKGHYNSVGKFVKPTGETKGSIKVVRKGIVIGGASEFLEFGTRYMPAQPFVRVSLGGIEGALKKSMDKKL